MSGRVLFLCPHLPHPNAPQAGQRVAWHNLCALAGRHTVDLLLVVNRWELRAGLPDWPTGVDEVHILPVGPLSKASAVLRHLGRISPKLATRCTTAARARLDSLQRRYQYDRAWLEFTEMGGLRDRIAAGTSVTVSVHDVLLQWALRRGGLTHWLVPGLYRDERRLLAGVDHVSCLNAKDAGLLTGLYGLSQISVVPPVLGDFVARVQRDAHTVVPDSLLFWGAMDRRENALAIEQFLAQAWPVIRAARPEARLAVVGSRPPAWLQSRHGRDGIVVTGFVEDPAPHFATAALGIAPLAEGAGVKLKVLEMLACGLQVVTTDVGAEGIPPQDGLYITPPARFAAAVLERLGQQSHATLQRAGEHISLADAAHRSQ